MFYVKEKAAAELWVTHHPIRNITPKRETSSVTEMTFPVSLRSRKEPGTVWLKCPVGPERKVRCMLQHRLCVDG